MKNDLFEKMRIRVLTLIEQEYASDADFEREIGVKDKTVSNWRRGKSSSFVKLSSKIAAAFGLTLGELIDIAPRADGNDLSEDEIRLLSLYRKTSTLPKDIRKALTDSIESLISLYLISHEPAKSVKRKIREEKA